MVMQSLRTGASGGLMKFFLFGILGMSVGGLVVMDVRGVFSGGGGISSTDVIKVKDKAISINAFDAKLRQATAQYNITMEQAIQLGVLPEFLTSEVREALISEEASQIGLNINKKYTARKIAEIIEPLASAGEAPQETLNRLLKSKNLKEHTFVKNIKEEMATDVLSNSIKNVYAPNDERLVKTLYQFQHQTRDINAIVFDSADIKDVPEPNEEELQTLYEASKDTLYKIPEYRSAQFAYFSPEDLDVEVAIEESEIKEAYESNKDYFKIGEQIVMTQIITQDEDAANKAYEAAKDNSDLKKAHDTVTSKIGSLAENVAFESNMLMPQMAEAIADREIGKIYPPVKTSLGYHVIKITKIVPPSIKPFEQVKEEIKQGLINEKKGDSYYKVSEKLDEALANGNTAEDIAAQIPEVKISSVELIDSTASNKAGEKVAIDGFDENEIIALSNLLFSTEENVLYPQELPSGKIVGAIVTQRELPSHKNFEDVKEQLIAQYTLDQKKAENELRVQKLLAELQTGGTTFNKISTEHGNKIQTLKGITIHETPELPLTRQVLPQIFKAELYGYEALNLGDKQILINVTNFSFPNAEENDAQTLEKIAAAQTQVEMEAQDEIFLMYVRALNEKYQPTINQSLLDRVYNTQQNQ